MDASHSSRVAAALAVTAVAQHPAHIHGGWTTGKSEFAVELAQAHVEQFAERIWIVADTIESEFALSSRVFQLGEPHRSKIRTMVCDEYADAVAGWSSGEFDLPALVVLDDADRYPLPAQPPANVPTAWISNPAAGSQQPPAHAAQFHLTRARTRDATVETMKSLGLPALAEHGQRTEVALRSPFYRRAAQALVTAVNAWGLACVPVLAPRGGDLADAVIKEAVKVVEALHDTRIESTAGSRLHKIESPRVALCISDKRSGGRDLDPSPITPSRVGPCLLEDAAAIRPDLVVIASMDPDTEHLTRLASTSRYGAIVVAPRNATIHTLLGRVDVPNWS